MASDVNEFIKCAASFLGCKESNGSHKKIIDTYNAHRPLARGYSVKYTDEWCATFVSCVAIMTKNFDVIPLECSCEKMISLFKKIGCFLEDESKTPEPGWIIFYDWQDNGKGDCKGHSDHVGIVEKVDGKNITVIEGNFQEAVQRRNLKVNGRYIRGYGVPKFGQSEKEEAKTGSAAVRQIALEVINGVWGNGEERKENIYRAVQNEVNNILK